MPKLNEERLMGLDVGRRTIGIAVSDLLGVTAQGVQVWRRKSEQEDFTYLDSAREKFGVVQFVVGHPIRTDGSSGPEALAVEAFANELERTTGCPVVLWDERFTTQAADRALISAGVRRKRRKAVIDMTAAALILQSYMERRRRLDE